jgi:hypothetical protein
LNRVDETLATGGKRLNCRAYNLLDPMNLPSLTELFRMPTTVVLSAGGGAKVILAWVVFN